jgi:hypothetical protein
MFKTTIDPKTLLSRFSDLEKRQIPFAVMGALNDALFDARDAWRTGIASVFDDPTQLTMNAVLYRKATRDRLEAELFLRNEATKGTPPSRYLLPQVEGRQREAKPFEFLLREAGVLGGDEFVTPARGFPLDPFGNVQRQVLNSVLSDLQASRDVTRRSTPESRGKRERRRAIGKRSVYFYSRGPEDIGGGKIQHLPRGIYERTRTGFGSSVRLVLAIVKGAPSYRSRFHAFEIANRAFAASFPVRFQERLRQGVATAKIK